LDLRLIQNAPRQPGATNIFMLYNRIRSSQTGFLVSRYQKVVQALNCAPEGSGTQLAGIVGDVATALQLVPQPLYGPETV